MKKTLLTIAIILGLGMTTFADPNGGGLFQRGKDMDATRTWTEGDNPFLPINHGNEYNANGQNTDDYSNAIVCYFVCSSRII